MTTNTRLLTQVDCLWATSQSKKRKIKLRGGATTNDLEQHGLDTPQKDEHLSDTLTFQSTTIDGAAKNELPYWIEVALSIRSVEIIPMIPETGRAGDYACCVLGGTMVTPTCFLGFISGISGRP